MTSKVRVNRLNTKQYMVTAAGEETEWAEKLNSKIYSVELVLRTALLQRWDDEILEDRRILHCGAPSDSE